MESAERAEKEKKRHYSLFDGKTMILTLVEGEDADFDESDWSLVQRSGIAGMVADAEDIALLRARLATECGKRHYTAIKMGGMRELVEGEDVDFDESDWSLVQRSGIAGMAVDDEAQRCEDAGFDEEHWEKGKQDI